MVLSVYCNGSVLQKSHFLAYFRQCRCRTCYHSLQEGLRKAKCSFGTAVSFRQLLDSLNVVQSFARLRKLNRQRSVFPSDTALLKALYLATYEATKKWAATIRNWGQVYCELSIMYEGRLQQ